MVFTVCMSEYSEMRWLQLKFSIDTLQNIPAFVTTAGAYDILPVEQHINDSE